MLRDASHYRTCAGAQALKKAPGAVVGPALFWLCPTPPRFDVKTSKEPPLQVYLNHGRWVVDCPDCNGAQLACEEDPRFMCNECGNVAAGGLWRAIEWPTGRPGIETTVTRRRFVHQNWLPGQTIEDLEAETLIMGGV